MLISPIKGCAQLRINQLLTIYQGVHITYFTVTLKMKHLHANSVFALTLKTELTIDKQL